MSSKDRMPNTTFSTLFQIITIKLKREADKRIGELGLNSQQGRVIGYIYNPK